MQLPSQIVAEDRAGLIRLTLLLTLAVLLADVASKNWVLATVGTGYEDLGFVALTVVENEGLAFSFAGGLLDPVSVLALRVTALACLLLLAWRFGPERLRFAVGFALVVGGGTANAADVLFRDGAVVDFISTQPIARALLGSDGFVMNLADLWILAGLVFLYPLFRDAGLATQRRLRQLEGQVLWDQPGSDGRR